MKETWMDRLGLPDESALSQSLVEIAGSSRVLIEHHCGVIGYGCTQVCVRVKFGMLKVNGAGLELKQMSSEQLIIGGLISSVELFRRENI